jgi:hypothetical protein
LNKKLPLRQDKTTSKSQELWTIKTISRLRCEENQKKWGEENKSEKK